MLATEEPTHPAPEGSSPLPALESHAQNARMRHIPTAEWMAAKLEADVRRRAGHLLASISSLSSGELSSSPIEQQLRLLGRALDLVAAVARHHHGHPHPPADLSSHVRWSIDQTIAALDGADETFGRRFPYHTGERSNTEPLWGAFLKVLWHLHRLEDLVSAFDPSLSSPCRSVAR